MRTSLDDALDALAATEPVSPERSAAIREALAEGERALFDVGGSLKRELGELHAKLLRSARFSEASLGTAAFIHELRQCTAPLIGLAELLRASPGSPSAAEWCADIAASAKRLADLVDRHGELLQGSGRSAVDACRLREVTALAGQYFAHLPPGVRLAIDVPEDLPSVRADPRALLHAILNLLANSRDAQRGKPGEIRIRARETLQGVEVQVADQGIGVPPAARAHLFEPLFTTKGDRGTGLGLFLSRELLRPFGELLLLEEGAGPEGSTTCFAIRLSRNEEPGRLAQVGSAAAPADEGGARASAWAAARAKALARVSSACLDERRHHVLLVEDEPAVRRMMKAILESVPGTRIFEAADAALAIGVLEKFEVDFLVCDKNLPDRDGFEVIQRAKHLHPDVDAMIVTGYPSVESVAEAIRLGATDYLIKPVREITTLQRSVESALARQRARRLWQRHPVLWREVGRELSAAAGDAMQRSLEAILRRLSGGEAGASLIALGPDPLAAELKAAGIPARAETEGALARALADDVDLLFFPADASPQLAARLAELLAGRPFPPALAAVGEFAHTEAAVATVRARGVVFARPLEPASAGASVRRAVEERRRFAQAEAVERLLAVLGTIDRAAPASAA